MRADPDYRQEARLALIERGGPSSVANPDAWVEGTAKRLQARARVDEVRELVAWCQSEGVYPEHYDDLVAIAVQRHRTRKPRPGKYTHAKSEAERVERRRKTWRESKARAYAAKRAS